MKTLKTKKSEISKLVQTNLDSATIKAVVNKVDKKRETTVKEKNFLYKFQLENATNKKKLTNKEEKRSRNKIRRNLKLIVNKIILENMKKKCFDSIKEFLNFYKANYILNDLSLKSLTNVHDVDTIADYTKVLELTKEFQTKK